jgi:hypothetical protein
MEVHRHLTRAGHVIQDTSRTTSETITSDIPREAILASRVRTKSGGVRQ